MVTFLEDFLKGSNALPRQYHQPRWMPCILYPAKMFLLQEQLGYNQDYTSQLLRMVRFSSLIYPPYWLIASIGADAPISDLILYKKFLTKSLMPSVRFVVSY